MFLKFKCIIGLHQWTKWEIEGYCNEKFFWQTDDKNGDVTLLKRYCQYCGLIETKTIRGHVK